MYNIEEENVGSEIFYTYLAVEENIAKSVSYGAVIRQDLTSIFASTVHNSRKDSPSFVAIDSGFL